MLNYGHYIRRLYDISPGLMKNTIASGYALVTSKKKRGGAYERWKALLEEAQWWDRARMREFQAEQLRQLLTFAAGESPYYRNTLASVLKASACDPFSAIREIPVLCKHEVRKRQGEFVTSHWKNHHLLFVTSGTTGTPLKIPMTEEALQRESAARTIFITTKGIDETSRHVQFTGQSLIPVTRTRPPYYVKDYVNNAMMCSVYHMGDGTLADYVKALRRYAPVYLYGYPSALYVLARYLRQTGERIDSVKRLFSCSEKLNEYQRTAIEDVFAVPLYQWYGQSELTVNVYECEHQRLHVKEEYGYLELLRDDGTPAGPGETARAIATGWGNRAFPLLRYETGDRMILSADQSCRCGRGGRILEDILGRDEDFIITPDGRHVGRLTGVFCDVGHVREGQIIQETIDRITIRIATEDGFTQTDEQLVLSNLRHYVGDGFTVVVEHVRELPRTANGKMRHVISKLQSTSRE